MAYPIVPIQPSWPMYERRRILERLEARQPIYVARETGQAAVQQLAKEGLVVFAWGEGKDAGIMVVRKAATGRPPPRPLPRDPHGGRCA